MAVWIGKLEAPAPVGLQVDSARLLMLALALVFCGIVLVLLAIVIWLSFTTGSPGGASLRYTTSHYAELLLSPLTYRVILNTLIFSALTLIVSLAIGFPVAWLVERTDFPGKTAVFTFMTVGLLLPGFSIALGWLLLLHPRIGVLNRMAMQLFGWRDAPMNIETMFGMGFVNGLTLAPLAFIMIGIVLRSMNSSLEEAASMGGANASQILRRVTLPLAWPGVLAASIYIYMIGFASFDVPAILGLPVRIYTFSTFVFETITTNTGLPDYGGVATLSVLMATFAGFLAWWYFAMQQNQSRYAVVTGKGYRPRQRRLGIWKIPAVAFVVLFFLLSELLPVLMLVWAAGLPFLQPISERAFGQLSLANFWALSPTLLMTGLKTTGILMVVVPTVTVLLSIAIAWVVLRSQLRWRGVVDFFAFLPHAIPSIVFSIAAWLLALFVLRDVLPIYGTVWILVLAYVVARISYGTRMMNSALIQLHPELEESATICGAKTGSVLRSVLLPLLSPAILYAWIWLALLTYRELTLAVILANTDNQPLAIVVWGLLWSSAYGKASAVSLIMIALMLPILALYWFVARRLNVAVMTD
jgi:iron(III) transport system permease protein